MEVQNAQNNDMQPTRSVKQGCEMGNKRKIYQALQGRPRLCLLTDWTLETASLLVLDINIM